MAYSDARHRALKTAIEGLRQPDEASSVRSSRSLAHIDKMKEELEKLQTQCMEASDDEQVQLMQQVKKLKK